MGKIKRTAMDIVLIVLAILALTFAISQNNKIKNLNKSVEDLNKQNEIELENIKDFIARILNLQKDLAEIHNNEEMNLCMGARRMIKALSENTKELSKSMLGFAKAVYGYEPKE